MNLYYWRVLAVAGLVVGLSAAYADDAEIVYYDVVGNSARELRDQMNTKGPLGEGGKRVDGHTDWHVAWSYQYAPAADGCKFTELGITVTATITLPRWAAGDNASNALVKKWQSYIAALRLHEDGHYSHGVRAAEEIKSLGQTLRTSDACSTFAKRFDEQAASILEKYKVADAAYDADTKHGQTQGAIFP
jgi:predicted secreted Zn-dependent protease